MMARMLSLIARNLIFTMVVPGLGGAILPWWILTRHGSTPIPGPAAWEAAPVVAAGAYRWVRNPIYIAALLVVLGEAWLFLSLPLLEYAGAMGVFFHLFVTGHEEPALSRRFGTAYLDYLRTVPRWIPHPPRHG